MKLVQKHTYNTNLQLKKLKTEKKLVLHIYRLKALILLKSVDCGGLFQIFMTRLAKKRLLDEFALGWPFKRVTSSASWHRSIYMYVAEKNHHVPHKPDQILFYSTISDRCVTFLTRVVRLSDLSRCACLRLSDHQLVSLWTFSAPSQWPQCLTSNIMVTTL